MDETTTPTPAAPTTATPAATPDASPAPLVEDGAIDVEVDSDSNLPAAETDDGSPVAPASRPAAVATADAETDDDETDRAPARRTAPETPTAASTDIDRPRNADGTFKRISAKQRLAIKQARIHAATREGKAIDRRLQELEGTTEARRRALEAAERRPPATPDGEDARADATAPAASAERPRWKDYAAAGKSWDEYEDALDAYFAAKAQQTTRAERDTEQRTAAERQEAEQRQRWEAQVEAKHATRIVAAREKYQDYAEVVNQIAHVAPTPFLENVVKHSDQGAEILYYLGQNPDHCEMLAELPMRVPMLDAVLHSKAPIELLAYFATHDAEVVTLSQMAPSHMLWRIAEIDRSLSQGTGAKTGSPAPAAPTVAPPPGHRAGARAGTPTRSVEDEPVDEYLARREREERQKRLDRYGLRAS